MTKGGQRPEKSLLMTTSNALGKFGDSVAFLPWGLPTSASPARSAGLGSGWAANQLEQGTAGSERNLERQRESLRSSLADC